MKRKVWVMILIAMMVFAGCSAMIHRHRRSSGIPERWIVGLMIPVLQIPGRGWRTYRL